MIKFYHTISLLISLLFISTLCCAEEPFQPTAGMIVPNASSGWAQVPMFFDYSRQAPAIAVQASCMVNYTDTNINFHFTIPIKSKYKPTGINERDGQLWDNDMVEVMLQPYGNGQFFHYMVNAVGQLYDENGTALMNRDLGWTGHPVYSVKINPTDWQVDISIPFSDLGFDPAKGNTIRGRVATMSNEPGNTSYITWLDVPLSFFDLSLFGTWTLSNTLPYAEKARLSGLTYDATGKGTLAADYTLKNPTTADVSIDTPEGRVVIPAGGSKSITRKATLGMTKLTQVDLGVKGIVEYRSEIKNGVLPVPDIKALDPATFTVRILNAAALASLVDRVTLTVDGKKLVNSKMTDLPKHKIDMRKWKTGNHKFDYTFVKANGSVFAKISNKVYTFQPEKIKYDVANIDVSRYYKPVKFDGRNIKAALTTYKLDSSILPRQITVNNYQILDRPISIRFDGRDIPLTGKMKIIRQNKNQFMAVMTRKVGDKTLTITADHRYDGFVWYSVTLESGKEFGYGPLDIVAPLKLDKDVLMGHDTAFYDELFAKAKITDIGAPTDAKTIGYDKKYLPHGRVMNDGESVEIPLTPYTCLATDTDQKYRGIGFCSEGPVGWNISNYDHVYTLLNRGNGKAEITMHISDGKTRWKTRKIKFAFGIEPFPMRSYPNNFHKYYRVDSCFWPTAYQKHKDPTTGKMVNFFDELTDAGATIEYCHENWTEFENYWKGGCNEPHLKKYTAASHEKGIKTIFYFGFLISNKIPEFAMYHDIVMSEPNSYPNDGFNPYYFYRQGDADQRAYNVCYNSIWGDHFVTGLNEAVKRYDLNGVYFDGTLLAGGCANRKHGCGVVDPYGRTIFTLDLLNKRRMGEIIYSEGIKKDPGFIIDHHMSWPVPPIMGLISAYWTGEAAHLFEPRYARTSQETLRAMMNGRLYGVPCDMLRRPEPDIRICWAQSLLVDTYVRLLIGGGKDWLDKSKRMWALYDKYNLSADTFVPYYISDKQIPRDNSLINTSYYETPKVLVVVISNYMNDTPQTVTLDLSAFKKLGSKVTDAWVDEDSALNNGKLTTTVPALYSRLMVIEKK